MRRRVRREEPPDELRVHLPEVAQHDRALEALSQIQAVRAPLLGAAKPLVLLTGVVFTGARGEGGALQAGEPQGAAAGERGLHLAEEGQAHLN